MADTGHNQSEPHYAVINKETTPHILDIMTTSWIEMNPKQRKHDRLVPVFECQPFLVYSVVKLLGEKKPWLGVMALAVSNVSQGLLFYLE